MTISRRTFIKKSTAAAAAVTLSNTVAQPLVADAAPALAPGPGNKWPGRVAINFNKKAVSDSGQVDTAIVKKMVDDLIVLLTGQTSVGAAWKEVFPATLSLQLKIAIKINTANAGMPAPHWASVRAITDGLQQMDFNGTKFPSSNITIYDMNFLRSMDSAGYTAGNFPQIALQYTKLIDGGDGALNNRKYASVLKDADFLINVFSPRGHTSPPAGSKFTLGFKSHVGTYAEDYREDGATENKGPALHDDGPYGPLVQNLREMNCTGPVFKKNVLSVCSGIFGMNEGRGPGGGADNYITYAKTMDASIVSSSAPPTTIMLSTDPIAIEMQSIKMMRINNNGAFTVNDMPPYLQASAGISGKMDGPTYHIGIIDETRMDIRRVINDVTLTDGAAPSRSRPEAAVIAVSASRGRPTFIEFTLPEKRAGRTAIIEIVRIDGTSVHRREIRLPGVRDHFSWDNRKTDGSPIGSGLYIVRITCGEVCRSRPFTHVN